MNTCCWTLIGPVESANSAEAPSGSRDGETSTATLLPRTADQPFPAVSPTKAVDSLRGCLETDKRRPLPTLAQVMMEFHSHLSGGEVSGYLAGSWDPVAKVLTVERAFPVKDTPFGPCGQAPDVNAVQADHRHQQNVIEFVYFKQVVGECRWRLSLVGGCRLGPLGGPLEHLRANGATPRCAPVWKTMSPNQ